MARFRNCWERPRREMCGLVGRRMQRMGTAAAANAWHSLGQHLERLEQKDIPKFSDLITAMRAMTIKYQSMVRRLKKKGYDLE